MPIQEPTCVKVLKGMAILGEGGGGLKSSYKEGKTVNVFQREYVLNPLSLIQTCVVKNRISLYVRYLRNMNVGLADVIRSTEFAC